MSKPKVYLYKKCNTCVKAQKFLNEHQIEHIAVPIVETPPTRDELNKMLQIVKSGGQKINKLFNTSGRLYREMGLSKKLPSMSEDEAIELLSEHGMLVKRPFALFGDKGFLGFKEEDWKELVK
ncbi:MAG TPA: arsenate reductase family protein [Chitinophagales bacterium]|nr:arsenate reductase family protein [Chitinophagales bacterium]